LIWIKPSRTTYRLGINRSRRTEVIRFQLKLVAGAKVRRSASGGRLPAPA